MFEVQLYALQSAGGSASSQPITMDEGSLLRTLSSASGSTSTTSVVGDVAHDAADDGSYPVKTGGKYNSSAPILANGDRGDTQLDVNANTKITNATLQAGEDLTNNVQKVEQRFTAATISTGVGTSVNSGSCFLHTIVINNPGTAWEIDVYDGTASSGTSRGKIRSAAAPTTLTYDVSLATGLFIDTVKGTTVGDLTVSYRDDA